MTWTISHGTPGGRFGGYHSRSYGQVGDWRDAVARVRMSARDASVLEPLLRRRSGDPFKLAPVRAAEIAAVLRRVHRQVPRAQREMNEPLAAAAERAAAAGEHWVWS
jgi:hypothetical protein